MQEDVVHVRSGIRQHETATNGIEEKRKASDAHTAELRVENEKYTAEVELKLQELDELVEIWIKHHPGDPAEGQGTGGRSHQGAHARLLCHPQTQIQPQITLHEGHDRTIQRQGRYGTSLARP